MNADIKSLRGRVHRLDAVMGPGVAFLAGLSTAAFAGILRGGRLPAEVPEEDSDEDEEGEKDEEIHELFSRLRALKSTTLPRRSEKRTPLRGGQGSEPAGFWGRAEKPEIRGRG